MASLSAMVGGSSNGLRDPMDTHNEPRLPLFLFRFWSFCSFFSVVCLFSYLILYPRCFIFFRLFILALCDVYTDEMHNALVRLSNGRNRLVMVFR